MHALSFHTWVIHISSVIEWMLAMGAVLLWGERRGESEWRWLALAMVPALASALCACTWHVYDNDPQLHWLVTVQAGLTLLGNCCFAAAAWQIWRTSASAQSRSAPPIIQRQPYFLFRSSPLSSSSPRPNAAAVSRAWPSGVLAKRCFLCWSPLPPP